MWTHIGFQKETSFDGSQVNFFDIISWGYHGAALYMSNGENLLLTHIHNHFLTRNKFLKIPAGLSCCCYIHEVFVGKQVTSLDNMFSRMFVNTNALTHFKSNKNVCYTIH